MLKSQRADQNATLPWVAMVVVLSQRDLLPHISFVAFGSIVVIGFAFPPENGLLASRIEILTRHQTESLKKIGERKFVTICYLYLWLGGKLGAGQNSEECSRML